MRRVKKCRQKDCPLFSQQEVGYAGNVNADVVFVGESPGKMEERTGNVLQGDSGDLLRKILRSLGISYNSIYFLNGARCRIDKDKLTPKEITSILGHCRNNVSFVLKKLKPKLIVPLGDIALRQIIKKGGITKNRGAWIKSEEFDCWVLPSFHPAYILRDRAKEPLLLSDLKQVAMFINNNFNPVTEIMDTSSYVEVQALANLMEKESVVGFDTETQGLDWMSPNFLVLSYSISMQKGSGYNVQLYEEGTKEEHDFTITWPRATETAKKKIPTIVYVKRAANFQTKLMDLKRLLENPKIGKVTANGNYDIHACDSLFMRELGQRVVVQSHIMDVQAAAHVLEENIYKQARLDLLQRVFSDVTEDYNATFGRKYDKGDMLAVPKEEVTRYAGLDADVTRQVAVAITKKLNESKTLKRYTTKLLPPTLNTLYEMEKYGVWIDQDKMPEVINEVDVHLRDNLKKCIKMIPKKIAYRHQGNLRLTRPDLIIDVLFSKEGFRLKPLKFTKSKTPSMDKNVRKELLELDSLSEDAREFLTSFNIWSEFNTLRTRYLTGLGNAIREDGRVHTSLSLVTAVTGRVACVPTDAEMLTTTGWKRKDALQIGERVIGYNVRTGELEITELKNIHSGYGPVGLLYYKHGKTRPIGIECTEEHAWVVTNGKVRGFLQAGNARKPGSGNGSFELVLYAKEQAQFGTDVDVLGAELVAWALTDGHIGITSAGMYYLTLKLVKKKTIARLRETLDGNVSYSVTVEGAKKHSVFNIGVSQFDSKWAKFLSFKSPVEYIVNLSPKARKAMWDVMMEADGSIRYYGGGAGYYRFGSAVEPGAGKPAAGDIFSALTVLLGKTVMYRERSMSKMKWGRKPFIDWEISEAKRKIPSYLPNVRECEVWCPETGTGTWVIRQNGVVGITGNSSSPNMQNNPKRSQAAGLIRQLLAAEPGWVFLSADQGQAELRWAAHVANEKNMIKVFREGKIDIHTRTAMALVGEKKWLTLSDAEKKIGRRNAKAINFGLLYGMSPMGFVRYAKDEYGIELTSDEANKWISVFFGLYGGLLEYHQHIVNFCRKNGWVASQLGRRRRLPEINSSVPGLRARAERQALNHPIQSPSSDSVLLGCNEMNKRIDPLECRPVLFIHDELIFEVKEDKIDKYAPMLKECMEHPPLKRDFGFELQVPLIADPAVGPNLNEMKELEL